MAKVTYGQSIEKELQLDNNHFKQMFKGIGKIMEVKTT